MIHWSPSSSSIETYIPKAGWNPMLTNAEKLKLTNLFFFFKNKKGFKAEMAEILAQMAVFKQKYHGLKYSDEQEAQLRMALSPIYS
jgi:predicted adenine nucleotide alpha hydrolase (AANH) superfamily ATPase